MNLVKCTGQVFNVLAGHESPSGVQKDIVSH